jgi:hypothetical protein
MEVCDIDDPNIRPSKAESVGHPHRSGELAGQMPQELAAAYIR